TSSDADVSRARTRRSALEQPLQSGRFEARRTVDSVELLIFLRMHSEVRRPETIAIGRKRNERGLRDRSAGFERARKLISFATAQLLWLPVGSRPTARRLLAEASVPSLRHERAAPCLGTPAAASSPMRLPEIGQFADSHSA